MSYPELTPDTKIGIVGSGNSASALACYLRHLGYAPVMFVRNETRARRLSELKKIQASGELVGEFEIEVVTCPQELCQNCGIIFFTTQANDYIDVAERLAPFLGSPHRLILFSSKFAGSLEVSFFLQTQGVNGVTVLETDALFACRAESVGSVWIRGIKKWTLYSGGINSLTERNRGLLESFFPGLQPAQNVIQRGLTDFGALAHPLTVLLNMNDIDRKRSFLFYYEGYTEKTVALLESMERDFGRVAEAYGTSLIPAQELLNRYYGCNTSSLLEAMRTVPNYRFSQSPDRVDSRYLQEDVPYTLIPVRQLARIAGIDTPMLDAVVTMASAVTGQDFEGRGRTLARLGWAGLSHQEILDTMAS